jgi:hypothetical protein
MADSENNMTLAETQPVSENERVQMTTNLAKGLNPEQYAAAFNYSIRNRVPLNFALAMDNRDMRDPVDVGGMLPETKRYFSLLSNAVISKGDESAMNKLFAASHQYRDNRMKIAPDGELYDAKFDEWLLPKQKETVKLRVDEMMVLAALRNKFSDFEKFDEARMEYEVGKMGEKLGIDTSRFIIGDMMPRGFSGEKFWNNLTDVFGYKSLTGKKADYKTLAETFNNLDKVTDPQKLSDLLKYMDSQQDALRGTTMFAEGAEGLATSLRFMAELYLAAKTLGASAPAAGASWAARLTSWAASAAEAVGVTLPLRALSAVDRAADALEAPEFVIGKDKNIELKATDAEMSDLAVAAANNLINDSIEVFSEQLGNLPFALGARSFVKPLLSNLVPDGAFKTAVAQAMQKVSASGGAAAMREFRRRVSLNGPFAERGEELAGDAMRALSTELAQALGIKLGDLGQDGITFSTRSEILMWGNILTLQGLGNVHTLGGVPDVFRAVAKAPGFTEAYRKVQEAADATNTKNNSPLLTEMTLRQQLGQKDKVYISVDDADALFQSAPETAGKIGIDETVISGARDLGVRIPISLAKLHANVTPQEAETLLPNLMFDPKHALRLVDAEKLDMSDEAQKAAEARWQAAQETRKAYDEAISQLTKLGRPETEIRTAARLLSMAEYFAAHSNTQLTAADWIRNVAFKRMKEADWLAEYKAKRGLFQEVPDISIPKTENLSPEDAAEVNRQINEIRKNFSGTAREIKTRIPFFKNWFGDWEKVESPVVRFSHEGDSPDTTSTITRTPLGFYNGSDANIAQQPSSVKSVSVVVDEKGRPLVVHHGTTARFNTFRRGDIGFHFGTREQAGNRVSEEDWNNVDGYTMTPIENAGILSGYLNIRNPLYFPADIGDWNGDYLAEKILFEYENVFPFELSESDRNELRSISRMSTRTGSMAMRRWLRGKGFDGIIYENNVEGEGKSYIIFSPTQFKSVENLGTFDPENGNFYHQSNAAGKHRGATYFENPENYNRRNFDDTWQAVITLFDGAADASTLVHEVGHYAFEMMGRLVDSGMADTRMVEDYNAIMAWASKNTKDPVQIKENLAKGFEAYVMEGKAPTAELTGAFAKLRQLMLAIYKSVKALGVTLTDEVRTVFDGMLASDAALEQDSLLREAAAELNTGLLGLSQSETEVFRELMEKAGNQALQELAAEKARQLTGLKKMWRTMAEDEMARDRTYKAWAAAVKAGGMDYLDVESATNSHIADALRKKGLTTKSGRLLKNGVRSGVKLGTHPADIAAKAGYDSVEEMLIDLYHTKSPADFTKQFMAAAEAEFHKTFEVTESAHSVQASIDMLDRFSDILAVKGGREGYRIRKQEFRRRAQARLAQMTVSRIVSDRSLIGDCRDNIKAMTKAVNESDFATALEAAQKLRENMEVMRQKADAKKAVERTVRTLSKARHAKKGSIYGDHQEALIDISRRFGFAQSERKLNHTAASVIAEYNAEARKNDDVEVDVDNYFLNESHSFKTMQFNNFEQLSNLVDFIYGEGKALVSAQEATLQEKVKTDIAGARADMAHVRNRYNRDAPAIVRTWRSMAQWGTKLRNIIGMATDWNKESTLQKLYDEMNYAQSMQMQLMTGVSRGVSDALKALYNSLKKIDLLPISDIRFPEAVGYRWDTERLVAICLNMGNATNRARLISGYGWGENGEVYLDRIASLLTAADWQNIQKIWNAIGKGELYEAVRRTFKNEKHFDLKEEEAAPFTVVTADGQQIEVDGGYYPLVYERFGSRGTDDSPAPAEHRTASFTYERAAVVSDPVKLSLSIVHTHVFDAAHYATHRETMRHVLRVIGNRDFASDFSMKFGYERYDALKKLVNNVANPDAAIKGEAGILERNLRAFTTVSALWANPSTVLMQLTSIPVGLDELGGFYRSAVHEMFTDYSYIKDFAFSRSALMRERVNEMDLDIRNAAGKFRQNAFDRISKGADTFGYGLMRMVDGWVVLPVWYAAYNKARLEGADETHAVAHADEFVARTQGSTRAIDMSPAQLDFFGRLFTMFFSATSAASTMATRTISKIAKGQGSPAMVACNLVLPVALASLVRFAMSPGGEDDPDRAERAFWRELMASAFQGIPLVRYIADAAAGIVAGEITGSSSAQRGYKDIFEVTVLRGANDIAASLRGALSDAIEGNSERALYRVCDAAGAYFRVPAVRVYERAKKILEGFGADGLPDINDTVSKKRKRR